MLITKTKATINIREAHNLWDLLTSKYHMMEKMLIYESLVHDPDLEAVFKLIRRPVQKNINILEKELMTHSVPSPDRNRASVQLQGESDAITDEYIAMDIFLYFQEHVENLLGAFYSSFTNDHVRKMVMDMVARTIAETNALVHYLRAKGWMEKPPMVRQTPRENATLLSLVEAASLHDHLTYRYDTMYLTNTFVAIVHDLDFKAILELGLNRLNKQIIALERQLDNYSIPFPKRPGKFTLSLHDIRFLDDDTIFRTLNSFMQSAGSKHAQAFKQATYNDDIRKFFKDLLLEEMKVFDDFIKFGKLKGWLNPVPSYVP
ncbi:MAG TPA: DUF3231 family protein [Firmicutes bacterium]|jgi:spore coat protein CotF|nr:DUF3231 family protein [Bacillota bacterium]